MSVGRAFTEGEWHACTKSGEVTTDADTLIIADVHGWTVEETAANAHLIGAAKMMLEALEAVQAHTFEYVAQGDEYMSRLLDTVVVPAIARARGEE